MNEENSRRVPTSHDNRRPSVPLTLERGTHSALNTSIRSHVRGQEGGPQQNQNEYLPDIEEHDDNEINPLIPNDRHSGSNLGTMNFAQMREQQI